MKVDVLAGSAPVVYTRKAVCLRWFIDVHQSSPLVRNVPFPSLRLVGVAGTPAFYHREKDNVCRSEHF